MLKQWMASAAHFWLFKKVAKLGYFRWILLPFTSITAPLYYGAMAVEMSLPVFLGLLMVTSVIAIVFTLSALQHFPKKDSPAFMAVEVRRGLIGIHIWKQFPSKAEMQELLLCGVQAAKETGINVISIQSPLFVKAGRLKTWHRMLRHTLNAQGYPNAYIEVVQSRNLDMCRSLMFSATRYVGNFDISGKHLPKLTMGSVPSAGFNIKL
ncbi:MAG: hypothetical protein Q7U16_14270 [Agitococcus sp.]|nr:hypothetical protein [Agitococcus sp.]